VGTGCLAFSPDGKRLAAGTAESTLLFLEVPSGREVRRIEGAGPDCLCLAFSPDGKWLAAGQGTLTVRDPRTGEVLRKLDAGALQPVHGVAFSPDSRVLASGHWDTSGRGACGVRLWDPATGRLVRTLRGHRDRVRALTFARDGKVLVTGSDDGTVRFWDVASGKEKRAGDAEEPARCLAFAPGGKLLLAGGAGKVRVWDLARGRQVRTLGPVKGTLLAMTLTADGRTLTTYSEEQRHRGRVQFWDPATGKERRLWSGPLAGVGAVALSPDGKSLALASGEAVALWDLATGRRAAELPPARMRVFRLVFSPDGRHLASASLDCRVRVWEVAGTRAWPSFALRAPGLASVDFSADGRSLVVWGPHAPLALWEVATGKERARLRGPGEGIDRLCLSPDGGTVAWTRGSAVQLRDLPDLRERTSFGGQLGYTTALAFSGDGRLLAVAASDGTIAVWEAGRASRGRAAVLPPARLERLWADLASAEAGVGWRAVRALAEAPTASIPFLAGRIRAPLMPNARQIGRLIAALDSDEFEERQRAFAELRRLGQHAEELLRRELARRPPLEVHRQVERLLARLERKPLSASPLRLVRAVEALEASRSAEARALLKKLARSSAPWWFEREVKGALARLPSASR
jgi:WD40 repeat protein